MPRARDPWGDELLEGTQDQYAGAGDDATQADVVRFVRNVAKLVRKRTKSAGASGQPGPGQPAVFLMNPLVPETLPLEAVKEYPMLDNGLTPIEGCVWLVAPVVVRGLALSIAPGDDAELFHAVTQDLALGEVPAVIYDPRTESQELRFYPDGLSKPDTRIVLRLPTGKVTLDDVFRVIDRVHATKLVTPNAQSAQARLWSNKDKHWVHSRAEERVQLYIETALWVAFSDCKVDAEYSQVSGRLDLAVVGPDRQAADGYVTHVVLELKVLRDFGSSGGKWSSGKTEQWISEGLNQAYSYANELKARTSALCCFDMRESYTGEACFDAIREQAASLPVALRVWYLFGSLKHYRAHVTRMAVTSASSR